MVHTSSQSVQIIILQKYKFIKTSCPRFIHLFYPDVKKQFNYIFFFRRLEYCKETVGLICSKLLPKSFIPSYMVTSVAQDRVNCIAMYTREGAGFNLSSSPFEYFYYRTTRRKTTDGNGKR